MVISSRTAAAPVRRIPRVEAQVLIGESWIVAPLEGRVRYPVLGTAPRAREPSRDGRFTARVGLGDGAVETSTPLRFI